MIGSTAYMRPLCKRERTIETHADVRPDIDDDRRRIREGNARKLITIVIKYLIDRLVKRGPKVGLENQFFTAKICANFLGDDRAGGSEADMEMAAEEVNKVPLRAILSSSHIIADAFGSTKQLSGNG